MRMMIRQDLLRLFVTLVAFTGLCLGVGGWLSYAEFGHVAGRAVLISPYFATAVFMCGLILLGARVFPKRAKWCAWGVLLIMSTVWVASYELVAWMSGRTISANLIAGVLLTGAVAAFGLRPQKPWPNWWVPQVDLTLIAVILPASIFVAFTFVADNLYSRKHHAQLSAHTIALDVGDRVGRAQTLVRRLSGRLGVLDDFPQAPELIHHELNTLLSDYAFFLELKLLDATGQIVATSSRARQEIVSSSEMTTQSLDSALLKTFNQTQPNTFIFDQPLRGSQAALITAPIHSELGVHGGVIAIIDLESIMHWAMRRVEYKGYFNVSHQGNTLYQSELHPTAHGIAAGTLNIPFGNTDLQLYYLYSPASTELDTEVWADFVWLAGLVFTFFLIASLRLTRIANRNAVLLTHNALHDPLTDLPNRRMLEQSLSAAYLKAKSKGEPLAVVFVSIDGMKLINDSAGYLMGDRLVQAIAKRLQQSVAKSVIISQIGDIEFTLVFSGLSLRAVEEQTEQIIIDLSAPYVIAHKKFSITVNAGIVHSIDHSQEPMTLVQQADLAMLRSRQLGRNICHIYSDYLTIEITEQLRLIEDLKYAIEHDSLELHYQPIVESRTGRVTGIEALARWFHPLLGPISPSQFIPLAEKNGQINALTEWVLATACSHSALLRQRGLPSFPVIVNISSIYFMEDDFIKKLKQILSQHHLAAACLELEITESVFLGSEELVIQKLLKLRKMGIKTSIDDFGTGYSSLSYLKRLPVHKVKIDRSFVTDVGSNPVDAAIVQGIITMVHHLGLQVVAEGVETATQFAFLEQSQCDFFQGYFFARPMGFEALIEKMCAADFNLLAQAVTKESDFKDE